MQKRDTAKVSFFRAYAFQLYVLAFVVVSSFTYGLLRGLNQQAQASKQDQLALDLLSVEPNVYQNIVVPENTEVVSLGADARINQTSVEAVSLFSTLSIPDYLFQQVRIWKKTGLNATQRVSQRRAIAVAVDPVSGRRYSLVIWQVPPSIRKFVSRGYPIQGTLAVSDEAVNLESAEYQLQEQVPGIPIKPGGSSGAVFSSVDFAGRSFTGSYTCPGSILENVRYYKEVLQSDAWRVSKNGSEVGDGQRLAQAHFIREDQELSLIFSAVPRGSSDSAELKTLVTVVLAPRLPRVS